VKSPPTAKNDDSGATPIQIVLPQQTAGGTSPSLSSRQNQKGVSIGKNHAELSSVITPAPSTKSVESMFESYTLANASKDVSGSYEKLRTSFDGESDAVHVNPRRVTLGGMDTFSCDESPPGTTTLTRNIPDTNVIEKSSSLLNAPPRKNDNTATSDVQNVSAVNPTNVSKEEPDEVLTKTGDVCMDGVTAEQDAIDSPDPSFEELFQSIMSKNLQFEDGWKTFEDKILDLSAELNMKHGNILEIEQSALHLKQEMGLKFQALLSHVEL
jgi:hypothetical protein